MHGLLLNELSPKGCFFFENFQIFCCILGLIEYSIGCSAFSERRVKILVYLPLLGVTALRETSYGIVY